MARHPRDLLLVASLAGLLALGASCSSGHRGPAPAGPSQASAATDHTGPLHAPEVRTPLLTRVLEFHGHIGPYVVLGYRAALLARERLGSPGYFDLSARVESPLVPPASCFIDGVQLGSGCTTGKRNLEVAAGAIGRATFTRRNGSSVAVALRPELPGKLGALISRLGVEQAGRLVAEQPAEELFVVTAGPGSAVPAGRAAPRRPLLVDLDMGLDDARVLIGLALQESFELLAVTTVEGSADAEVGARNALALLEAMGSTSVPVAVGARQALSGPVAAPPWRSLSERLGGLSLPTPSRTSEARGGEALLAETLRSAREPVTVLALGPLTNIARILLGDPGVAAKIRSIHVLGDLVRCESYNCTTDRPAAAAVLASGVPIDMVVHSATDRLPFDARFLARVSRLEGKAARLVASSMKTHAGGEMKLWDDAVLAGLLDGGLLRYEEVRLPVRRATDLDAERLRGFLLDLWAGPDRQKSAHPTPEGQ
jgi:inosine-uridine nucleoside N-ribohydrolase